MQQDRDIVYFYHKSHHAAGKILYDISTSPTMQQESTEYLNFTSANHHASGKNLYSIFLHHKSHLAAGKNL